MKKLRIVWTTVCSVWFFCPVREKAVWEGRTDWKKMQMCCRKKYRKMRRKRQNFWREKRNTAVFLNWNTVWDMWSRLFRKRKIWGHWLRRYAAGLRAVLEIKSRVMSLAVCRKPITRTGDIFWIIRLPCPLFSENWMRKAPSWT